MAQLANQNLEIGSCFRRCALHTGIFASNPNVESGITPRSLDCQRIKGQMIKPCTSRRAAQAGDCRRSQISVSGPTGLWVEADEPMQREAADSRHGRGSRSPWPRGGHSPVGQRVFDLSYHGNRRIVKSTYYFATPLADTLAGFYFAGWKMEVAGCTVGFPISIEFV